jgi:isopenicillin N synthase-like dioxygenase
MKNGIKNLWPVLAMLMVIMFVSCGGKKSQETDSFSYSGSSEKAESESDYSEDLEVSEEIDTPEAPTESNSGNRKEIDDFFKSYEAFVVKLEKAKSSSDTMALLSLATQSMDLASKAEKLQDNDAWTTSDLSKYSALSLRAAAALQ